MLLTSALIASVCMQGAKKPKPAPAAKPKIKVESFATGTGDGSKAGDLVTVDYTGRLANGKVFDSSIPIKGEAEHPGAAPLAFPVGMGLTIQGFDQATLGKKVGSKFRVTIPAALGYGAHGTSDGTIPPNSVLTFDINVLGILKKGVKQAIKIEIKTPGTGEPVQAKDSVTIHYTGTFLNGKVFDSSRTRNTPYTFEAGIGKVVPGFDQAVLGMKKGERRKVTIPPDLAYGDGGGRLPPQMTLVFDIELLDVKAG